MGLIGVLRGQNAVRVLEIGARKTLEVRSALFSSMHVATVGGAIEKVLIIALDNDPDCTIAKNKTLRKTCTL